MAAAKKTVAAKMTATRSVARQATPVVDQGGYLVRSHVVINRKGYGAGEVVTDLTEQQATELLELKVIEAIETDGANEEDPPAD
jgi:hypothetical protein